MTLHGFKQIQRQQAFLRNATVGIVHNRNETFQLTGIRLDFLNPDLDQRRGRIARFDPRIGIHRCI